MFQVEHVEPDKAEELCRKITKDLPEYFGLEHWNERYALGVRNCYSFSAKTDHKDVGLLSVDFPYPNNARVYWLGVCKKFHRLGIGRSLMESAYEHASKLGANTITVETLSPAEKDPGYLGTYSFYRTCGFEPLFDLKPYEDNMVYMLRILDEKL